MHAYISSTKRNLIIEREHIKREIYNQKYWYKWQVMFYFRWDETVRYITFLVSGYKPDNKI